MLNSRDQRFFVVEFSVQHRDGFNWVGLGLVASTTKQLCQDKPVPF
jgi:hypothetical protein